MDEEWRQAPGFPDYEVSSLGRVRRVVPDSRNHTPGILKPWLGTHGYAVVGLSRDGVPARRLVHRLVCEAFHGTPPSPDHVVAHGDGSRTNHRADNLRWATYAENMADAKMHGALAEGERHWTKHVPASIARGERHGLAKLTEADVIAIRAAPKTVGSGRALAKAYGVAPASICRIRSGQKWKHVTDLNQGARE